MNIILINNKYFQVSLNICGLVLELQRHKINWAYLFDFYPNILIPNKLNFLKFLEIHIFLLFQDYKLTSLSETFSLPFFL